MRLMPILLLAAVLAAPVLCGAEAGTPQNTSKLTTEERFALLDRNKDGKLNPQELPYPEVFKRIDKNGDGFVTLIEMREGMPQSEADRPKPPTAGGTIEEKIRNLDANRDGKLTPQELGDPGLFNRLDANHDGFVTYDEARAYANPGSVTRPNAEVPMEQKFRMADKNGDGKLSPDEFNNPTAFRQADKNGDGFVTLAELQGVVTPNTGTANGGKEAPVEERFTRADADADGKLNKTEVNNDEFFTRADTNKDGFLSLDEVRAGFGANKGDGEKPNGEMTVEQKLKLADKDGDGKLSQAEYPNAEQFIKLDANGDGFLTLDELRAAAKPNTEPNAEQRFKGLDKNTDGKITPEELPYPEHFKKVDTNNDGVITLEEMKTFLNQQKPVDPNTKPGTGMEGRFKQMDTNGDGKLTPDELPYPELFKKLDTNGDGVVTLEEAKAQDAKPAGETAEAKLKKHDRNGDGKLTADEINNPALFKYLDKNGDGVVTLDELRAGDAKPVDPPLVTLDQQFKQSDKDGNGKLDVTEFPNPELFKKLDTNADGFVSWDEAKALAVKPGDGAKKPEEKPATLDAKFKSLDKNGDGKLTAGEIPYDDFFKTVDANGDAAVTLDELKGYMQAKQNK